MKSKRFILAVGAVFAVGCLYAIIIGWPFATPDVGLVQDINQDAISVLRSVQGYLSEQHRLTPSGNGSGQAARVSPFALPRQPAEAPAGTATSAGPAKSGAPVPDGQTPTLSVGTGFSLRVSGTFLSGGSEGGKCTLVGGSVLSVGDRVRGGWILSAVDSSGATFTRNGKKMFCRIGGEVFLEDLP